MRNAFVSELLSLALSDKRVVLLSGDIGNRLFDKLKQQAPDRFHNCGVAEANMTSVAAGMALCGLRPITYTITPFVTARCLEQIRVDVSYHNAPVVIVGVGSGLSYASLGATHHSCEDIAFLRALPNMTVLCPCDPMEVRLALRAAIAHGGPVYMRIGKKGEPVVHENEPPFQIGKAIVLQTGADVCLLGTGVVVSILKDTAKELERHGLSVQVVSFHTVKPLDETLLQDVFARFKVVVAAEEHSLIGGFSASVAEWLADRAPQKARLCRIGTEDRFLHEAGDQDDARQSFGLTSEGIAGRVLKLL